MLVAVTQALPPLDAINFTDPQGQIVLSAEKLASAVVAALKAHEKIEVSVQGLSGVSSSYFNALLLRIAEEAGAGALTRIQFHFRSDAQRQTFQRSFDAVLASMQRHA